MNLDTAKKTCKYLYSKNGLDYYQGKQYPDGSYAIHVFEGDTYKFLLEGLFNPFIGCEDKTKVVEEYDSKVNIKNLIIRR